MKLDFVMEYKISNCYTQNISPQSASVFSIRREEDVSNTVFYYVAVTPESWTIWPDNTQCNPLRHSYMVFLETWKEKKVFMTPAHIM